MTAGGLISVMEIVDYIQDTFQASQAKLTSRYYVSYLLHAKTICHDSVDNGQQVLQIEMKTYQ